MVCVGEADREIGDGKSELEPEAICMSRGGVDQDNAELKEGAGMDDMSDEVFV